MAIGAQITGPRELAAAKTYAKRVGIRITESLPESPVTKGGHSRNSWHYDKVYWLGKWRSKGADFNYGRAGTSAKEKEVLTKFARVSLSMGLGTFFGAYGHVDNHDTHAHSDNGGWSNLGRGLYHQPRRDLHTWDLQPLLKVARDNLYEGYTRVNLEVISYATDGQFPRGKKYAQYLVGVKQDGVWGAKSKAALKRKVAAIQKLWKKQGYYAGKIDGLWGPKMDEAFLTFEKKH